MTTAVTGTLYGLGLGPGDPELVTVKALRLLRVAPVIAYPAPEHGDSFARHIVAQWLVPGRVEIAVRFPMRPGAPPAAIYREAAARIAAVLDDGRDVAYLCQGDPLFFGSFAGILDALGAGYRVAVVPGVSSPMACAAAALMPLAQVDESLVVMPATLPEQDLARRLAAGDAAVILKLGRHFAKVRRVLARLGRLDAATYVAHAGWPSQAVMALAAVDPAAVPYFATALVPRKPPG